MKPYIILLIIVILMYLALGLTSVSIDAMHMKFCKIKHKFWNDGWLLKNCLQNHRKILYTICFTIHSKKYILNRRNTESRCVLLQWRTVKHSIADTLLTSVFLVITGYYSAGGNDIFKSTTIFQSFLSFGRPILSNEIHLVNKCLIGVFFVLI